MIEAEPYGIDETRFAQAVQLAGQFVANGDLRLGTDLSDSQGLDRLQDLIPELYRLLRDSRRQVLDQPH